MRKIYVLFFVVLFIVSCASVYNVKRFPLDSKVVIAVLPFKNYTETPMAGLRASSIADGVLRAKGYSVYETFWAEEEEDFTPKEIKQLFGKVKKAKVRYAIVGSVNEWRYKTGIDGEPAVSLTVRLYDLQNNKTVWGVTGAKTGWSHESLGTIAQKLINRMGF